MPSLNGPVPLLPLPNVVLLPGGTLPLQIFEPRYRRLVKDTLRHERLVAMALLQPGYEPYYYTNLAEIYSMVCVGRIREHVRLPDGRFLINLLGLCRARVRIEESNGEYRRALLEPVLGSPSNIETDEAHAARHALGSLLEDTLFDDVDGIEKPRAALDGETSLDELLDVAAATLLPADAVEIKQRLLEELNLMQRTETLLRELAVVRQTLEVQKRGTDHWPRFGSMN